MFYKEVSIAICSNDLFMFTVHCHFSMSSLKISVQKVYLLNWSISEGHFSATDKQTQDTHKQQRRGGGIAIQTHFPRNEIGDAC